MKNPFTSLKDKSPARLQIVYDRNKKRILQGVWQYRINKNLAMLRKMYQDEVMNTTTNEAPQNNIQ